MCLKCWTNRWAQYNDIRQEDGFKNVIVSNRMLAESQALPYPFIDAPEEARFQEHKFHAYYWWVVLHELLGHGTGWMMVETADGRFNFDTENPPVDPVRETHQQLVQAGPDVDGQIWRLGHQSGRV